LILWKSAYRRNFQKPLNLVHGKYLVLIKEKGEISEMKKKIALAFAGLLLMIFASFAPTTAQWPPAPTLQTDKYIVTGGEMDALVQLELGGLPLPPLNVPFVSRAPYVTPQAMWQNISFSIPLNASGVPVPPYGPGTGPAAIVFLTVPWMSIKSLEHVFFSGTLGYTRIKLLPIPGSDGMGWLYTLPGIADVDIYAINTFMPNPYPGPYNVTNPPQIPIALWTSPSPMNGTPAAIPSFPWNTTYPFPYIGADGLPGFLPTSDDGFGDGVPDPAGSSVLFLPLQMSVESWNGTAWEFTFGGPFVLPMTTGTAFDIVVAPGRALDGTIKMFTGAPWDANKKFVTYAYAWSFIQYYLSDGPPVVKLDLVYGGTEKKVKDVDVIPDINCDNTVNILDILVVAASFGSIDEGAPAPPGYDPTGEGEWPGPYPAYMPALWTVDAQPNLVGNSFDARADLDNNGIINILDIVAIAVQFGATL